MSYWLFEYILKNLLVVFHLVLNYLEYNGNTSLHNKLTIGCLFSTICVFCVYTMCIPERSVHYNLHICYVGNILSCINTKMYWCTMNTFELVFICFFLYGHSNSKYQKSVFFFLVQIYYYNNYSKLLYIFAVISVR